MTEQNNNSDGNNNEKSSKFNYYWIYVAILIAITALYFFPMQNNIREITEQNFFRDLLPSGDVSKIILVDKEYVEVYLKPEAADKPAYKPAEETRFGNDKNAAKFYFYIASIESFMSNLQTQQNAAKPEQVVPVSYE